MRVLHFIHALAGGGAEKQLLYLARASRQDDVHIAYVDDRGAIPEYPDWVKFHHLRSKGNYALSLLFEMRRLVCKVRPEIIQTWTLKFDVLAGMVRLVSDFDWVIRESGSFEAKVLDAKNRIRLALGARASAVVSNSKGGDRFWADHSRVVRREIIHNGYDVDRIDRILATPKPGGGDPVFIFIGRLIPSKNPDLLIKAMQELPVNVRLFIVGDGPERRTLEVLCEELGLQGRVTLTGYLPHPDTLSLLSASSALVLPSQFEGTPNVVLEAMMLRVPVVISDCEPHKNFFPDNIVTYFSLDAPRPDAELARALLCGCSSVQKQIVLARAFAQKWSMETMAEAYSRLYLSLRGYKDE